MEGIQANLVDRLQEAKEGLARSFSFSRVAGIARARVVPAASGRSTCPPAGTSATGGPDMGPIDTAHHHFGTSHDRLNASWTRVSLMSCPNRTIDCGVDDRNLDRQALRQPG
jgi:hypothetical protein